MLGKSYEEEIIDLLKQSTAFAIGFDESDVNKTSEFEILVKIAIGNNTILLQYYKTVSLESGDVNTIFNIIVETFQGDGIKYESKCFGAISDGYNVNEGRLSGLKKKLLEKI